MLNNQGKYADAETLYREALDGSRRELGEAHPITLVANDNLEEFLKKQKKFDEAASYYDQAAYVFEQSYGANHEETRDALARAADARKRSEM